MATVSTASGRLRIGDSFAELLNLAVAFAELGLDGLHLLTQHVLPLRVGHLLLGLRFDLPFQLQHIDLTRSANATASSFTTRLSSSSSRCLSSGFISMRLASR